MDAKTFGAMIRNIRESKGLTLVQVAERLGISQPTLGRKETGTIRIKPNEYSAIAAALEISDVEFNARFQQTELENQVAQNSVSYVNSKRDGGIYYNRFNNENSTLLQINMDSIWKSEPDVFAVQVIGDSMEPDVKEGAVLICKAIPTDALMLPFSQGDMVVAIFSGDTLKPCMVFGYWSELMDRKRHLLLANMAKYRPIQLDVPTGNTFAVNMAQVLHVIVDPKHLRR